MKPRTIGAFTNTSPRMTVKDLEAGTVFAYRETVYMKVYATGTLLANFVVLPCGKCIGGGLCNLSEDLPVTVISEVSYSY